MKIWVHAYMQMHPTLPIGSYRTTVTIVDDSVTVAVTLAGKRSRVKAIRAAADHLRAEHRWSNDFINRIWDTTRARHGVTR